MTKIEFLKTLEEVDDNALISWRDTNGLVHDVSLCWFMKADQFTSVKLAQDQVCLEIATP